MLNTADRRRLRAAIARVEAASGGEVFCVVAAESSKYRETALAAAAAVALLGPPLTLLLGLRPAGLVAAALMAVQSGWTVEQAGAVNAMITAALVGYAALQTALFALGAGLTSIPAIRRVLTPARFKREHVRARAMEQFAHRTHTARADASVLIYVSLAERMVEILADENIHRKAAPDIWDRSARAAAGPIGKGDIVSGLVAAVEICGEALAERFPRRAPDPPSVDADHVAEV